MKLSQIFFFINLHDFIHLDVIKQANDNFASVQKEINDLNSIVSNQSILIAGIYSPVVDFRLTTENNSYVSSNRYITGLE